MSQRNTADLKQVVLLSSRDSFHPYTMPPTEKGLTDIPSKTEVSHWYSPYSTTNQLKFQSHTETVVTVRYRTSFSSAALQAES